MSDLSPGLTAGTFRAHKTAIVIRHAKYLNDIVEQNHKAGKRVVKPMLGFMSFWSAPCTLAGIEVALMIKKGQMGRGEGQTQTAAGQFYVVVA